jgi:hypothetical protein
MIAILTTVALFQSLFWIVITPGPGVLPWDLAAQNNVALYITQNGYIPRPSGSIYRPEYVSYPSPYILWAIISEITSIQTYLLMLSPILTYSMYILFLWIVLDALNTVEKQLKPMIVALLISIFIVNYRLTEIFIYQNYGRVLLLFALYLVFKELISNSSKLRPLLIIIIINIMLSHSESSIALLVASLGLVIELLEKSKRKVDVTLIPLIALIAFCLYYFYNITYFSISLIDMLKKTLEYLLKQGSEIITAGLAKYTPSDYTLLELALYAISLFLLSLSALASFIIGIAIFLRHRKIAFYLGPLALIGISVILLFWFSPYKSDISLKFIPSLSIMATISFIELSKEGYLKTYFKKHFKFLGYILIIFAVLIILGFAIRSDSWIFSTSYSPYHSTMLVLDSSGSTELLANAGNYKLILVDSPSLPYYFIRDYVAPRLEIPYSVAIAKPENLYYNYHLINGILMPRTMEGFLPLSANILQRHELVIGTPDTLTTLKWVSIVFNAGLISVGICSA